MDFNKPQKTAIEGLSFTPKRTIKDERGAVFLMLKDTELEFPVGEIYFSMVRPEVIKGWKLHSKMRQRFAVPIGKIAFVFVDQRKNSPSFGQIVRLDLGAENYGVLSIPNGLWYSFKGQGDSESLIVNAASIPREDGELTTTEPEQFIHYKWS